MSAGAGVGFRREGERTGDGVSGWDNDSEMESCARLSVASILDGHSEWPRWACVSARGRGSGGGGTDRSISSPSGRTPPPPPSPSSPGSAARSTCPCRRRARSIVPNSATNLRTPPPPPPHQLSRPMHTHSALPSSIQKAAQHHARSLVAATPAATRHDALIHCAPCVRGGRGTAGGAYALGRPAARHDAQKAARNAAPPHADATVAVPGGPRPLGPPATLTDGSAAIRTLARARPRTAR